MWVQCGIPEGFNRGKFGGLSLDFFVGKIPEVRNDKGDGDGMILDLIVEYILRTRLTKTYGLSLDVSSLTEIG